MQTLRTIPRAVDFHGCSAEALDLLDLARDAILVRDMDRAIIFWNRGAEELYGWTKSEAMGRTVHELLKTEYPGPIEDFEAEVLRTGRWEGELGHFKRDGSRVVMASHWTLQRDDQGRPLAILEINSDITDQKTPKRCSRPACASRRPWPS